MGGCADYANTISRRSKVDLNEIDWGVQVDVKPQTDVTGDSITQTPEIIRKQALN
jgi:hypothetical protein